MTTEKDFRGSDRAFQILTSPVPKYIRWLVRCTGLFGYIKAASPCFLT